MSKKPAIVAELGRPETPEETSARKAEFSKTYRASQTFRNLIAALIITVAVVAVVIFAVPRGEPVAEPSIDVAAIAADVETAMQSPAIVPETGDFWRVNAAELQGGSTTVWNVTLAPASQEERGFIRIAQAFGTDSSWAPQMLSGTAATDTTRIGGLEWDVYTLKGTTDDNVSYAIGTQAGDDYILLYGSRSAESTAELAETLVPQIEALKEAS
ncbi:DUF4245 family protein [uncultured Microbacterium sp.]|uniref:DUF4245 family protein n=1 Tax=uncultured Microbacterium sp. TaxID=191216 RepID=UPI00260E9550|nr:DUF4245 family protein [uncultured Microbacterium sp.]